MKVIFLNALRVIFGIKDNLNAMKAYGKTLALKSKLKQQFRQTTRIQ
jgi:hypothetical protein